MYTGIMALLSLTELRSKLYRVVDQVIRTGVPQEIERNGHRLKIVLEQDVDKLSNLTSHHGIVGDPDALVEINVSTWQEENNL